MEATVPRAAQARGPQPLIWLKKSLDGAQGKVAAYMTSTAAGKVVQSTTEALMREAYKKHMIPKKKTTMVMASRVDPGSEIGHMALRKGFGLVVFVLEPISDERIEVLKAFEVAMAEAECYVACHPEAMLLNPYESQFNCAYHVKFTGPEILAALDSIKPDFLVTEVHSGATIACVGACLKSRYPDIKLVAVESAKFPVLSGSEPVPDGVPMIEVRKFHALQGLGGHSAPKLFCMDRVHEIMQVQGSDARTFRRSLAMDDHAYMSLSSAAVCLAAARLAHKPGNERTVIVAICPSVGDHYLAAALLPGLRRDKVLKDGMSDHLFSTCIPGQQDIFQRPKEVYTPTQQPAASGFCASTSVQLCSGEVIKARVPYALMPPSLPCALENAGQSSRAASYPAAGYPAAGYPAATSRGRPRSSTTRVNTSSIAERVTRNAEKPDATAIPCASNAAPPTATATAAPTATSIPRVPRTPVGPNPSPAARESTVRGRGFDADPKSKDHERHSR